MSIQRSAFLEHFSSGTASRQTQFRGLLHEHYVFVQKNAILHFLGLDLGCRQLLKGCLICQFMAKYFVAKTATKYFAMLVFAALAQSVAATYDRSCCGSDGSLAIQP